MAKILVWLRLPLFILGILLLFVNERYFYVESYHLALRVLALALVALGVLSTLGLAFLSKGQELKDEARGWFYVSLWQLGLAGAIALYFGAAAAAADSVGAKLLLGAWWTALALSVAAGIGLEWAMSDNGRGAYGEPRRVWRAGSSWLMVGMLLVILVCINYVGNRKNVMSDWSYLKVTTPSQATEKLLKTLTTDVTIALFYPQGNEVRMLVANYFDKLAQLEPRIKVSSFDKDLDPTQAEAYRASRNGQIIMDVAGKRAVIETGETLAKARKTLKGLDSEFQKSFLEITAAKKTIYFTRGHGESSWIGDLSDNSLKSLQMLETFLRQQNYTLKLFGVGEGSVTAVPDDAAAVIIVGPTLPFQKEEVDVLKAYLDRGGSLMAFLDIEKGGDLKTLPVTGEQPLLDLLAASGIRYHMEPLANDRNHVSATRSQADVWFLFTNVFTSHESVSSLARHDERLALLVFQSGYLTVTPETGGWKAFETVRSLADTFVDANRNFVFDEGTEKRDAYILGAAAEKTPAQGAKASKILVLADATVISDPVIRNPGNALFFADNLKWLVGDTGLMGDLASEDDVRIRHTRKEDTIWFHGTVIVVPLLVLGVGFLATRRRKQAGESAEKVMRDAA